jgi:hypothetical protein
LAGLSFSSLASAWGSGFALAAFGGVGLGLGFLAALGSGLGDALGGSLIGLDLIGGGLLPAGNRFQRDRAAFRLDRLDRTRRRAGDLEGKLTRDLAISEQAHAVLGAADQPRRLQRLDSDRLLAVEPARIDGGLDAAEIELVELLGEDVVETALRQAPMQRHLTTFEALDGDAGARLLALHALARGLAQPRADTAAEPLLGVGSAWLVSNLVQPHDVVSLLLCRVVFDDAHEMGDFRDHAAHLRAVDQRAALVHLVEPEPDQGRALHGGPPDRTTDLLDDNRLLLACVGHLS